MLAAFLGAIFGFFVVSAIAYTYFKHVINPFLMKVGKAGLDNAKRGVPLEQALVGAWVPQDPHEGPHEVPHDAPREVSLPVIIQITEKLEGHWQELRAKCGCELCVEILRIYGGAASSEQRPA